MKSKYNYYFHKLKTTPAKVIIRKLLNKSINILKYKLNKTIDLNRDTRLKESPVITNSYIDINLVDFSKVNKEITKYLCESYLSHKFDLLGSGWVKVDYDVNPLGVEGYKYDMSPHIKRFDRNGEWIESILLGPHTNYAKEIWNHINNDYNPIDWQIDYKSGYRFDVKKWYQEQKIGEILGADIKVPWELSRLQHLPQMALFAAILPDYRLRLLMEFKNQVLDFIMMNPPRMGANWVCTMDVGIRAANILLAYDMFKQQDKESVLDKDFIRILSASIYEHGKFIVENLEWSSDLTSNHYLANICGLLFVSAYLERNKTIDSWLVFSVQEIIEEVGKQFYEDGSNFEASTSYHRLSGEMAVYSTALVYGILETDKINAFKEYDYRIVDRLLPIEKQKFCLDTNQFFTDWYLNRLLKSGCFAADITKPNGEIPQIGDNDSGRFFRLSPNGELIKVDQAIKKYENLKDYIDNPLIDFFWDENILNHGTFVAAVDGLFDEQCLRNFSAEFPLEKSLINALSKAKKCNVQYIKGKIEIPDLDIPELKYSQMYEVNFIETCKKAISLQDIEFMAYPDFGLYIYKSDMFQLTIMAGRNGQNGNAGHTHNDKLSFDLYVKGKDIFVDPGTYLYTPLPYRREQFRSVYAHNVAVINNEEQNERLTLFSMKDETKCYIINFNENFVELYLIYRSIHYIRSFKIFEDKIVIIDRSNYNFQMNFNEGSIYSNGYGKLLNAIH